MLECNRNGRPIPSRENINAVMKMNHCTFEKTSEYGVTMFVDGVRTYGHEDASRFIWERCVALDFLNAGLLRAIRMAIWQKMDEIRGYVSKETARTDEQGGNNFSDY